SKPFRSYSASILNLAELNPRYSSILDFKLGDAINLISKKNKIKDKQRIVKTIEWPQDHTKDSVELANATLKFEDIQQENQETSDTVSNITTDNGTINGSTIDSITTKQIEDFEANVIKVAKLKAILAEIENLHVNKADIQNLNAVVARIGTLEATKASITELNAIHAIIQQIKAGKADITDLNAAVAKVGILENKTAVLENALAGNLTADNFKTNAITAGSAVIAEGAIGSSQISSLSVNKLEAGDITTSKHRIVSADGTIEIVGNQILINRNNVNRVILGEYRKSDGTTEYGLLVRAKDGQTIMLDGNGVHNAGITDGAIDNNKVADNANISGNKLDINSVIREVNNNGTETIKGTKVTVGDRTLDVELSTQKNTITEHSKELSSQKATIQALDSAIKLKVDSQTFTQSTQTINSNINRAKEQAIIGARSIPDTRNDNQSPGWYIEHYPFQSITEFKYSNVIQIPNGGYQYGTLETKVPWNNSSGGYPTQVFRSNSFPTYQRHGINETTWSSWEQIEDTQGSQAKANSALSNAKSYSDSKKQEAIKVAENLALEKSNLAKKYADEVATAKANLAQANAIANADGKITEEERKRIQQAQENLNTAISKADKAKQDAILEANRVAELKKQEAISSANSHADNKAAEALNNAKAFVNAEITTVNSHLNKATAEINVLKEKIESKVSQSDIDKSIQEIKIGGRNLALGTSLNYSNPYSGFDGGINKCPSVAKVITDGLKVGDIVTVRLLYKYENIVQASSKTNSAWLQGAGDVTGWGSGAFSGSVRLNNFSGNGTYEFLYSFTVTKEHMKNNYWDVNLRHDYILSGSVCWKMFKVEKGNKATDWTPAPEDTNQLIVDNIKTVTDKITTVESKFTQENNSIKASVQDLNSTTQNITTNVSNINRDLTSKINSNLDAAKSFATDIAIAKANLAKEQAIASADGKITAEEQKRIQQAQANLNTAIAKATEAETKAKSYADVKKQEAINSANNNTNNAINNIKIGGRNYGLNTDVMQQEPYNIIFSKDLVFEKGKTYTISMDFDLENLVKGSQERVGCEGSILFKDGTRQYIGVWHWISQGVTFKGRKSYTFTIENKDIKDNMTSIHIYTELVSSGKRNLGRFKIEEGNKATDYTIAPEDLQSYADKVAKAKADLAQANAIANADGKITEEERKRIQQAQENLNTAIARADFVNAEITTVNNKVHNVESNIDILKNKIALKVEQSDIDKTKTELINKINVVDNLANNAKDLASAMRLGKMLFSDPTFKNSSNNIKTYNNNGNGTVTTSRISKINGCPTDSQYCIEVKTVGSASPNHGGFYFGNMTRANAIFVTKIIAKIPVGLRIGWYSNSTG
ncbi:MAG: hypothetical protein E6880_15950, partial [Clostridium perfringens]|nr:hypothetical protein [Clostridium perfringens]